MWVAQQNKTGWCYGNWLFLYSEGTLFESWQNYLLLWLKYLVVFLSMSRLMYKGLIFM